MIALRRCKHKMSRRFFPLGSRASYYQASASAAARRHVVKGEVEDNMTLCKVYSEGAGEGLVSPMRCPDASTVVVKSEGYKVRARATPLERLVRHGR